MADATWTKVFETNTIKEWTATINSTDAKTAVLPLTMEASDITIMIDIGATESAIQIKGAVNRGAVEADMQILTGASAIAADFDDRIYGGLTGLQVTGATSANDTVITVVQKMHGIFR